MGDNRKSQHVRLSPEAKRRLNFLALVTGKSATAHMAIALDEYLGRQENENNEYRTIAGIISKSNVSGDNAG